MVSRLMIKISDNTNLNRREYKPPRGAIAFAPELVSFILRGEKQSTYRFGLKYDYIQVGDKVDIIDSSTEEVKARVVVKAKASVIFKNLPLAFDKHESYRDKNHQRQVLGGYYAYIGREIRDDDVFLVFEFECMERT